MPVRQHRTVGIRVAVAVVVPAPVAFRVICVAVSAQPAAVPACAVVHVPSVATSLMLVQIKDHWIGNTRVSIRVVWERY